MFALHVLGCHGAGKSTLLQTLAKMEPALLGSSGFHDVPFTWLPRTSLVMVGDYTRHPPRGMDQMRGKVSGMATKPHQLAALDAVIRQCPTAAALIWEGVAMQHMGFQHEYAQRNLAVAYVYLNVPLKTCFERIVQRGGKTQAEMVGNGKSVRSKHVTVVNLVRKLHAHRTTVWELDGTKPMEELARYIQTAVAVHRPPVIRRAVNGRAGI